MVRRCLTLAPSFLQVISGLNRLCRAIGTGAFHAGVEARLLGHSAGLKSWGMGVGDMEVWRWDLRFGGCWPQLLFAGAACSPSSPWLGFTLRL